MKPTFTALTLLVLLFLTTNAFAIQILSQTTRNYVAPSITDCRPVCLNKNSNTEGWYYPRNKSLIKYAECRYCSPACMNALNSFEGWYDSCTGLPLVFTNCNQTVLNPQKPAETLLSTTKATTLITTTKASTTTTTLPACGPVCIKKSPSLKGWFNYCTKELVKEASCTHCSVVYKDGGWYDGCNSRLIMTAGTVITTTTTSAAKTTTTVNTQTSSLRSSMVSSAVSSAISQIASSIAGKSV
ncbi:MAG: hypothetical protein FJY77_00815 [Candidatus Altiarchaeales archaeon]|nr:hypothetical protein [Candidatus Altiarchaeales archaeon]